MKTKFLKLLLRGPAIAGLAAAAFFGIGPPLAHAQSLDWGDAPSPYPTLSTQNGARHTASVDVRLGPNIDFEANGQPNSTATGDDTNPPTIDDEDGVTIPASLLVGQLVTIQVQVSVPGVFSAWFDFNGDGDWADAGELVFANNSLPAGFNNRSFTVPATARVGTTFARFRYTTTAMSPPAFTGLGPLGEVEDYQVRIASLDFGDAPTNNYPTLLSQDGARHIIDTAFFLGSLIDSELDGQPNANATGDDINPATADDEDGIAFLGPLTPGSSAGVQVTATIPAGQSGRLDAWVDFNADGDWADTGEQIFLNAVVNGGVNTLTFTVPGTAVVGPTFCRFRLSRQGGLRFSSLAPDGEVEDYLVQITPAIRDFGDAPDPTYPTLLPNGASHTFAATFCLGTKVDGESNGQPNAAATGDDIIPSASDDEDGVTFTSAMSPGQPATVEVVLTAAAGESARLDAWIDFNNNGSWLDAGEQIFVAVALAPGVNTLVFNVPASAKIGGTFARFRLSRQGDLRPEGFGQDGEVEDYLVNIQEGMDFSDAPEKDTAYPTTLTRNGARHVIVQGLHLGELIDAEPDGQPNDMADGDDLNPPTGLDDEDGVIGSGPLIQGRSYTVEVIANGASFAPAYLNAWIDFNGDGDWADPGEQIFTGEPLFDGPNSLTFSVPATAITGETYGRFRYSRQRTLSFGGPAPDGEVEDYRVPIIRDRDRCDLSCTGVDFWLTFPGNYAPDADNPVRPSLCVVGSPGVVVTVDIPGFGFSANRTIPALGSVSLPLPKEVDLGNLNDGVTNKGIHVTANNDVAIYAISKVRYTSDSYLALSTAVLGTEHIVMAWPNLHTNVPPLNGSQFAIVACDSNTTVTITPSDTTGGHTKGVPYNLLLQAGDTYQLRNTDDKADLTGTVVTSDKPIAVFGSHRCAQIPTTNQWFCDYLVEQLPPVNHWGMNVLTAPLEPRGSDTFRVLAAEDNTTLSLDGAPLAPVLNRGEYRQFSFALGHRISADKPILVAQYAKSSDADGVVNSDPFMSIVQATRHYETSYTVCSFTNGFGDNFLNIIAPDGVLGTVTLNGGAVGPFFPIIGSGYSYAQVTVTSHRNTVTAAAPIGVSAYGWAEYESYGHPACFFVGDVRPPTITCNESNVTVVITGGSAQNCFTTVPDLRQSVTTDDNCSGRQGVTVRQTPAPGTPIGPGIHTITLTAIDASGNKASCTMTLTVIDPSPVIITCPSNITVFCTDSNGARVTFSATARSTCDTNVPVVCNPPSGSVFPPGNTTVVCDAFGLAGQKDTCAFNVEVRCAGGLTIHRTGDNTFTVTWTGSAGTLQQATSLEGPWLPVISGVNSYSGTFAGPQAFFRVLY